MLALLLPLLLSGCGRLSACAEAPPPPPVEPVALPVVEPTPPAPSRHWAWAAVVRVDPARTSAREISLAAVEGSPAPAVEPTEPEGLPELVPVDVAVVRDALGGEPLHLYEAPPGASLEIPLLDPEGAPAAFTVPLPVEGQPAPTWLVVTDLGVHALSWPEDRRVQEIEVALSITPWRVVIALPGPEGSLGSRREEIDARLAEQGVLVLEGRPDAVVAVPWEDAPMDRIDVAALIAQAGPESNAHYVLAESGKPPMIVRAEAPVMLLKRASSYFGLSLLPPRTAEAGPGEAHLGKGGKMGKAGTAAKTGKQGKAFPPGAGMGPGKAGKARKQGKMGKQGKSPAGGRDPADGGSAQ